MISVRLATMDDAKLLFKWVNDPVVRETSLSRQPISWQTHVEWLESKIASTYCLLFVALDDGRPVGTTRLDRNDDIVVVSISLAKEARGKGLAKEVLETSVAEARRSWKVKELHAYVRAENAPSIALFNSRGFERSTENEGVLLFTKVIG